MVPPRPPLTTPAGCFLSNTAGAIFGMGAIVIGVLIGDALGGFEGARLGFVTMGVLAFFTPWRRWVLRLVRRWQQRRALKELGLTDNDLPPPREN